VNFAAVSVALGLPQGTTLAAAMAADVLVMAVRLRLPYCPALIDTRTGPSLTRSLMYSQLYISIITAWPVNEDLPDGPAAQTEAAHVSSRVAEHSPEHLRLSAASTPPVNAESVSAALAASVLAVASSRVVAAGLAQDTAYLAFVALFASALGALGRQMQPSGALFAGVRQDVSPTHCFLEVTHLPPFAHVPDNEVGGFASAYVMLRRGGGSRPGADLAYVRVHWRRRWLLVRAPEHRVPGAICVDAAHRAPRRCLPCRPLMAQAAVAASASGQQRQRGRPCDRCGDGRVEGLGAPAAAGPDHRQLRLRSRHAARVLHGRSAPDDVPLIRLVLDEEYKKSSQGLNLCNGLRQGWLMLYATAADCVQLKHAARGSCKHGIDSLCIHTVCMRIYDARTLCIKRDARSSFQISAQT